MSRLQQCIDALEAEKCETNSLVNAVAGRNMGLCDAIAIVSRILSAKPSEEEIEAVAKCLAEYHGGDWKFILKIYRSGEDTGAYHRFIKMAKAALLTAFPQQEKI